MVELVFYLGLAFGLVAGLITGLLLAPRKRVQRPQVDAVALAQELARQGGFKLTVQTDCDAIAAAIVDADRRADSRGCLH